LFYLFDMDSKELFVNAGEVRGTDKKGFLAVTHQFTPDNPELKSLRGNLYVLISIDFEEETAHESEKEIYDKLLSAYYSRTSGNIILALNEALEEVKQLVERKKQEVGETFEATCLVLILWGTVAYVGKIGEGAIFLSRKNELRQLGVERAASGVISEGDTFLLSATNLKEILGEETLKEALGKDSLEATLKNLDQSLADKEGLAALVLFFSISEPSEFPQQVIFGEVDGKPHFYPEEKEAYKEKRTWTEKINQILEVVRERSKNVIRSAKPTILKIRQNISPILRSVIEKALQFLKSQLSYPTNTVEKRRKLLTQAIVVLVAILIISIFVGAFIRNNTKQRAKINNLIEVTESRLNEAQDIASVNSVRAQTLLADVNSALGELEDLDSGNRKGKELKEKYDSLVAQVFKLNEIEPIIFYDLKTIKGTAMGSKLVSDGNNIFVLDSENKTLYQLDLTKKEANEVEIIKNKNVSFTSVAATKENIYLFGGSIYQYRSANGSLDQIIPDDSDWKNIVDAGGFLENLYLLDAEAQEVWKYPAAGNSLGSKQRYLRDDKPDFKGANSIAIDGSVWIASPTNIWKFTGGRSEELNATNLDKPFAGIVDIYTNPDTKFLYVLDKGNSRIVLLEKNGSYSSQYISSSLSKASAITVAETKKATYVLIDGNLYSFDLK